MGLEALSRGAVWCCFFERNRAALGALRRNIEALGAGGAADIVTLDAWRHAVLGTDGRPFDLVLLDPPYRDSEDVSDDGVVKRYLGRFGELDENRPLIMLHHQATVRFEAGATDLWRIVDQRSFGTNTVTFFER